MKTILKKLALLLVLSVSSTALEAQTFDASTDFRIKNKVNGKCVAVSELLTIPQVVFKDCTTSDYRFKIIQNLSTNTFAISGTSIANNQVYALQYPNVLNLLNLIVEPSSNSNPSSDQQSWIVTKNLDDTYNISTKVTTSTNPPLLWTSKILGLIEIGLLNSVYLSSDTNSNESKWYLETVSAGTVRHSNAATTVYPNPVKQGEDITINLSATDNYVLKIVNTEGTEIKTQNIKGEKAVISTAGMRQGIYFYNAKGENNAVSGKFSVN